MPSKFEWLSRIKAIEREYLVMRRAADRFQESARDDPALLDPQLSPRDILDASKHLEGTYIVRLFAEFETGARQCWSKIRKSNPKTSDLLEGLAARFGIPDSQLDNGQLVREYRNSLVHEREETRSSVAIAVARSHLCHFFSFLPEKW